MKIKQEKKCPNCGDYVEVGDVDVIVDIIQVCYHCHNCDTEWVYDIYWGNIPGNVVLFNDKGYVDID